MQHLWHPPFPTATDDACLPEGLRSVQVREGGFRMATFAGRDIVSNELLRAGYWEVKQPQDILREIGGNLTLPTRGTFLDIGGNLGYYSLLFANHNYTVTAVEPMTRNRLAINCSLCLNPSLRDRLRVVPSALVAPEEVKGSRCVIRSTSYNENVGNGRLKCGSASQVRPCSDTDMNCEEVPVTTLDALLEELNLARIDVVKIDIEGYECNVLRGGQSLFKRYRPRFMQVETHGAPTCVHRAAHEHGYHIHGRHADTLLVAS